MGEGVAHSPLRDWSAESAWPARAEILLRHEHRPQNVPARSACIELSGCRRCADIIWCKYGAIDRLSTAPFSAIGGVFLNNMFVFFSPRLRRFGQKVLFSTLLEV